ncbi:MAG: response regulator [Magnetococcales bacterium]|nr:response regulator [Magnetococcales bacterium]
MEISSDTPPRYHSVRGYRTYLAIAALFVVLSAFFLIRGQLNSHTTTELAHLKALIHSKADEADTALEAVLDRIRELHALTLDAWRNPDAFPPSPLYSKLIYKPEINHFSLEYSEIGEEVKTLGLLHGMENLAALSEENREELNASLYLLPFLRSAVKTTPQLSYIYLQSARFRYAPIFPAITASEVSSLYGSPEGFADAAYTASFWTGAIPENNPDGKPFWSDYYIDIGASGLLFVSYVMPVWVDQEFRGIAAADIRLDFLSRYVKQESYPDAQMFIVNDKGDVLNHSSQKVTHKKETLDTIEETVPHSLRTFIPQLGKRDYQAFQTDDYIMLSHSIGSTDWQQVLILSRESFYEHAWSSLSAQIVLMLGGVLLLLAAFWMLERRFIAPAQQLVSHIDDKANNLPTMTLNRVPDHWKPWFSMVGQAFDDSRSQAQRLQQLNEELNDLNTHLEERVLERTAQLERLNSDLSIAKEGAEAANSAKSAFLANMSHELRTPMNAILGFTRLIARNDTLPEEERNRLRIISSSGEHLLSIINDVLDMSKVEAGRMVLEQEAGEPAQLIRAISDMVIIRAQEKELLFDLTVTSNVPPIIKTDLRKLRQCLINLLANAVKFTDKGLIQLHVDALSTPHDQDAGSTMIFRIQDTGCGIAPNDLETIFEPFVQSGRSPSSLQGTGLGLAITRQFARLLGGDVTATSVQGKGSTFLLEIPVEQATEEEVSTIIADRRPVLGVAEGEASDWKMLIVDDWTDNRLLLRSLLEFVGFQVKEAENGARAVTLFEEWQPHLIWMDLRMPIMDGREATRSIRAMERGEDVSIIALTASAFSHDHEEILTSGCDAVIQKPFPEHEIFDAITHHLGIEFRYKESTQADQTPPLSRRSLPLSPEEIDEAVQQLNTALPEPLIKDLHSAALLLDRESLAPIIETIREDTPLLADHLNHLMHRYQFDRILQLLDARRASQKENNGG